MSMSYKEVDELFAWCIFSIQLARSMVCWTVMGVSTRTADVDPWISVQQMGDHQHFSGSRLPVAAGMIGAT